MRKQPAPNPTTPLWPAAVTEEAPVEGVIVGAGDAPPQSAQTLLAEWIDHCPMPPVKSVKGQVARRLKALLDEGVPYAVVRQGFADWHKSGLAPTVLDSFVNTAGQQSAAQQTGRRWSGNAVLAAGMDLVERLGQQQAAGQ
jgi:hypothetical protein